MVAGFCCDGRADVDGGGWDASKERWWMAGSSIRVRQPRTVAWADKTRNLPYFRIFHRIDRFKTRQIPYLLKSCPITS